MIVSIINFKPLTYDDYTFPLWANRIGWGIALSSMILVPAYIIYKFMNVRGTFKEVSEMLIKCHEMLLWNETAGSKLAVCFSCSPNLLLVSDLLDPTGWWVGVLRQHYCILFYFLERNYLSREHHNHFINWVLMHATDLIAKILSSLTKNIQTMVSSCSALTDGLHAALPKQSPKYALSLYRRVLQTYVQS